MNVKKFEMSPSFYLQLLLLIVGFYIVSIYNTQLFVISILIFIAGNFNGNADSYEFSESDNIWSHILTGKVKDWYFEKYRNQFKKTWWIHPIFYDGWHFWKNLWVGTLLFTITFALYISIQLSYLELLSFFVYTLFNWMVGKELWHHHLSHSSFWGLK